MTDLQRARKWRRYVRLCWVIAGCAGASAAYTAIAGPWWSVIVPAVTTSCAIALAEYGRWVADVLELAAEESAWCEIRGAS